VTQDGYLVLADISGFTRFIASSELDHAQGIIRDLLEVVVDRLRATFTISKLEGDAVFAHAPAERIMREETILESVEGTYVAFREKLRDITLHTTCDCRACRSAASLDLKVLTHYGRYATQSVAGAVEVVGNDVNLVHRLLKNGVEQATGWRAYALFTSASLGRMGLAADSLDLHERKERYEHVGEIGTFSLDLAQRYDQISAGRRVLIEPEDADVTLTQDFPAPAQVVWDWLTDPHRRTQWSGGPVWRAGSRRGGRTGPGSVNHCSHGGKTELVETILDWRPFEYHTAGWRRAGVETTMTSLLEPLGERTRVHLRVRMSLPLPRPLRRAVCRLLMIRVNKFDRIFAQSADMLGAELSSRP
jgi:uncharacterized protein YndB with AHSA1/START domain